MRLLPLFLLLQRVCQGEKWVIGAGRRNHLFKKRGYVGQKTGKILITGKRFDDGVEA